jgi:nitrogen regulatory protein P-II 2
MHTKHPKTLLVVVAEGALERLLLEEARAQGAQAWSVVDVRCGGVEGVREGSWEADRSVEIRLVCEPAVADALADTVMQRFAPHYQVALYFAPVQVLRPDRY